MAATSSADPAGAYANGPETSPYAQIPREVWKWMQSLELSHTVKDAKFDLANGYLYAQMLQRYYPKEVSTWSFENGLSLEVRVANWEHLFRVGVDVGWRVWGVSTTLLGRGDHYDSGRAAIILWLY